MRNTGPVPGLVLGTLVAVLVGLPAPPAVAADFTVDTTVDENDESCGDGDCSLRDAVALSTGGETIDFDLPGIGPWTIALGSELSTSVAMTIVGPGIGTLDIEAGGNARVLRLRPGADVTISDVTLSDGTVTSSSDRDGGGIFNEGNLTLVDVRLTGHRSFEAGATSTQDGGDGGAVYNASTGTLTLTRVLVDDNRAGGSGSSTSGTPLAGRGGAIFNAGILVVDDSTFDGNRSGDGSPNQSFVEGYGGDGGALYNAGTATIRGSAFVSNRTGDGGVFHPDRDGRGGAIANVGTLDIVNATFVANRTGGDGTGRGIAAPGGGLYNGAGTTRLRNVTVTGNVADADGGGLRRSGGTASVANSVLAENTAGGEGPDCSGTLSSLGFNFVGQGADCGGLVGDDVVGSPGPLDPQLAALGPNGGPTETRLPIEGSPLIDAGDPEGCTVHDPETGSEIPLTVDQRDVSRPQAAVCGAELRCDVGSVEVAFSGTQADLAIDKDDGGVEVDPGGLLTYTVRVDNLSEDTGVTGASVADLPPDNLSCSWTCVPDSGASCDAGPIVGDLVDQPDLPASLGVTYTGECAVDSAAAGTIENTASVSSSAEVCDLDDTNDSDSTSTPVVPTADLAATKDDGVEEAVPGGQITYTIAATNAAGPGTMDGARVTDPVPSELHCDWACVGTGGGDCTASPPSGDLDDFVSLPPGGSVIYTATCDVDAGAVGQLSNTASVEPPTGAVDPDGSNDSDTDVDLLSVDLGDAPAPYPTLVADDGARHVVTGPRLGAAIDAEADGQPSADASGDGSDEDGVAVVGFIDRGDPATVEVTVSAPGLLSAWVDFDGDGSWLGAGEAVVVDESVSGTEALVFPVPANAVDLLIARFRLSTEGGLGPTGSAVDGEVEDYLWIPAIFADGFESGTTDAWSTAIP